MKKGNKMSDIWEKVHARDPLWSILFEPMVQWCNVSVLDINY